MSNDMIFQSFNRISHYPIVHESMECFLKVYHWIKSKNKTIHGTFTKVETLLITIQNSTLPMAASKLKPLDQVLNKQLERFEKFFPVVLDDTDVVLNNTINTVVNPMTNSISCLVHKGFKLVSNLSHLTEVNYEELIYNTIESVFNYFIPEIDDTLIVSANCSHTNQKSLKLSKKTFHRLSKITIAEIDRFHKLNVEYLQNIHILVNRIKNEGEALYNEIPPNINLIMEDIFNNSRLLDNSLSTFKITPNNSIAFDLAGSLDFLKKNISKLQIILFESKLDFDNDKFFNKMNFATDQIYSGFDTFCSQLRNFADRKSKSTDEKRTKLSDSFYSIDHDYLSDCTLYESDLE